MKLYPLKFKPVYKDYIWGGDKIASRYNRSIPGENCAESWEISAHPDGMSVVENGKLAGTGLSELAQSFGERLLGTGAEGERFPLLIKLIDAKRDLSVQVHPHNENAHLTGGEPKTEMWYILDADPGTELVAGLMPGVDREQLRQALERCEVEAVLNRENVEPGDVVYMPGGRVHAICAGALILEVQQSSNTTYRLYDWGRTGKDGKARQLHIDEALQVIRTEDDEPLKSSPETISSADGKTVERLLDTDYFRLNRLSLQNEMSLEHDPERFRAYFCESGSALFRSGSHEIPLETGRSLLLPADLEACLIIPQLAACRLLEILPGQSTSSLERKMIDS